MASSTVGVWTSSLRGVLPAQAFTPLRAAASGKGALRSLSRNGSPSLASRYDERRAMPQRLRFRRRNGAAAAAGEAAAAAVGGEEEVGAADDGRASKTREEMDRRSSEVRAKVADFFERKAEYKWLLGPAAVTAAIVVPSTWINLVQLFQANFLGGLMAVFGIDVVFVLAADLFLVLAEKLGHHQQLAGGSQSWTGPWEHTGYPKGYPKLLDWICYASVGVGALAFVLSFLVGKFPAALATFGPYLALLFAQVAYERLVGNDKLPTFPLVPILFTVYRFRQLSRAMELVPVIANGSGILTGLINVSSILWALYLGMYLTQLPWLYSTWNASASA